MPIFDFRCKSCNKTTEHIVKSDVKEMVCECGEMSEKIITFVTIHPDFEPYLDEHLTSTPVWVKSKQHRKQLMEKYGVYEKIGKGWDTSFR